MPVQQGVMSTYQLTAHNHSGVGQGGLVPLTSITNHNKVAHDILNIDADTCDLQHLGIGATVEFVKLTLNQPGGGSNLELVADDGNIPVLIFIEGVINRGLIQYDSGLNEFYIQALSENADLHLVANGTGKIRFGTHAAIGAETVTGFINIKDGLGNARKLAVVS